MIEAIVAALQFAALKWLGVIDLSWLWIIGAVFILPIPCAKTILFVVFQLTGLFAMPISWWWIILPIVLDLMSMAETAN